MEVRVISSPRAARSRRRERPVLASKEPTVSMGPPVSTRRCCAGDDGRAWIPVGIVPPFLGVMGSREPSVDLPLESARPAADERR
jgi:hypothetical protein